MHGPYTEAYPAYKMRAAEFLFGCTDPSFRAFHPEWPPLFIPNFLLGRSTAMGGNHREDALFHQLNETLTTGFAAEGSATTIRYESAPSKYGLVKAFQPILSAPAPKYPLFEAFARGEIDPRKLDPPTEFWRRVLMYLAPNHDFVTNLRRPDEANLTSLYETIREIQTYSSHALHFIISLVQSPSFAFVRLTNTHDTFSAGINFIPSNTAHNSSSTLRQIQHQVVGFDKNGFFIPMPEEPSHSKIRQTIPTTTYGHWLEQTTRLIRAMAKLGYDSRDLDFASLKNHRPNTGDNFTLNQAARSIANFAVAKDSNEYFTIQVLNILGLPSPSNSSLPHLARYQQDIHHALENLLGLPSYTERSGSTLDSLVLLLATAAHYLQLHPDQVYATVPSPEKRDRVIRHQAISHY